MSRITSALVATATVAASLISAPSMAASQGIERADGTIIVRVAADSTRLADGTIIVRNDEGAELNAERHDGTIIVRRHEGSEFDAERLDGTIIVRAFDGTIIVR